MAFVSSELGIDSGDIQYHKGWSSDNGKFAFMRQYIVRTRVGFFVIIQISLTLVFFS